MAPKRKAGEEAPDHSYHLKMLREGHKVNSDPARDKNLVATNTKASFGVPFMPVARPVVGHSAGMSMPGLTAPNGGVVRSQIGSVGGTTPFVGKTSTDDDSTVPKVLSTSYIDCDPSTMVPEVAAAACKKYQHMLGEFIFQQRGVTRPQADTAVMQIPAAVNEILRADGAQKWNERRYPNLTDVVDEFVPAGVRYEETDSQNSYRSTRFGGAEATNKNYTVHIQGETRTPRHVFESEASGRIGSKLWWAFVWHREPETKGGERPRSYWKLIQIAVMDNSTASDDITLKHGSRLGMLIFCGTQIDVKDQKNTQRGIPPDVAEREMMSPTLSTADAITFMNDQSHSHVALNIGYAVHLGAGHAWINKYEAARSSIRKG